MMNDEAPTRLRSPIPASAPKVVLFTIASVLLLGILASLIGNVSLADSRTYYGIFTDATSVNKGDRVRVSGVEVGSVKGLDLITSGDTTLARVKFEVKSEVPVYRSAELQLRYENVVGLRYLAINEIGGSGARMPEGGTFPVTQTKPALNLTELFNGFQPLFQALDPERLNEFSYEMVRAFQGESGSVQTLVKHTASLTNTLADREGVLRRVITNLNTVMATVADRDDQLEQLIVAFRDLMVGLADDRDALSETLPDLATLLSEGAGIIRDIRPPLADTVHSLGTLSAQVDASRGDLDASLKRLPRRLNMLARTASYGSWFNFYVCGLGVRLELLDGTANLSTPSVAADERETVCGMGAAQ
jgi:phospholipid/cholesterol/gamma-HCH transport system substrate-binding protein